MVCDSRFAHRLRFRGGATSNLIFGQGEYINKRIHSGREWTVHSSGKDGFLRDKINGTVCFVNCFLHVPLACLGSMAGLVHQWNSGKIVFKPHSMVHFVSEYF